MNRLKILLLLIPTVFIAAIVVMSGFLNFRFGSGFGATQFDRDLFGYLSASIDGFKSMLPVIGGVAIAYGARRLWSASWAMWGICAVLSLASSFGFVVQSRQDTTAVKSAGVERRAELSADRKSIKGQTKRLKARPFAVVDADYQARCYNKRRKTWRSCKRLLRERGRALAIQQGRMMTSAIDSEKSRISVTSGSDQQVNVISNMMAKTPFAVMVTIAILFSIILELVTGFGPAMLYAAYQYVLLGDHAPKMRFELPRWLRFAKKKTLAGENNTASADTLNPAPVVQSEPVENKGQERRGFISTLLSAAEKHEQSNPRPVSMMRRLSSSVGVRAKGSVSAFFGEMVAKGPGLVTGVDAYGAYQAWCKNKQRDCVDFIAFNDDLASMVVEKFPAVTITREPRGRRFGDKIRYDGLVLVSRAAQLDIKQVV